MVEAIPPTMTAAKTRPVCWRSKLWLARKTRGIAPNWRYKMAQLKETQSENQKTTDSVKSMWRGRVRETEIILARVARSSSDLTFQRIRWSELGLSDLLFLVLLASA